jgi:hypothetical protein
MVSGEAREVTSADSPQPELALGAICATSGDQSLARKLFHATNELNNRSSLFPAGPLAVDETVDCGLCQTTSRTSVPLDNIDPTRQWLAAGGQVFLRGTD